MKNFNLPQDHRPYIDKYFLRAKEILKKEGLNPIVKAQIFIRQGNCKVYGINEAIAILTKYANSKSMKIYALKEGDYFKSGETLITIEAPIQDIIDLETMYLGVLSARTTLENNLGYFINLKKVRENMEKIVELIKPRPVSYFGVRHWHYTSDYDIAKACKDAGATNCSTDAGAKAWGKNGKGIGTIPHALEAIYHWKYGLEYAVILSTGAFDRYMDISIPRIALVDYANREITDSINVAHFVDAIRIDTCGENYMEGVLDRKGVTVEGVYLVRKSLNDNGFSNVKIILSSGFGNPNKVKTFLDIEKRLNIKLFDSLGVGGVFESRMATMDIIEVEGKEIHKVGRISKPNNNLRRQIWK